MMMDFDEETEDKLYIIHAEKFDKDKLKYLTINQTNKYYDSENTLIAETANINSNNCN